MQKEILKKEIKKNYGKIALEGNTDVILILVVVPQRKFVVIQITFLKNKYRLLLDIMKQN